MTDDERPRPAAGEPRRRARPLAADVFDTMPVAVGLFGSDGVLLHANPVLADLLGATPDRVRGSLLVDLVEDAERDRVANRVAQVLARGRNAFECLLAVSPAGLAGVRWPVRAHVSAAYGPTGQVEGLVLQVFDFGPADAPPPLPSGLAEVLEEGSDFLLTAAPDGPISYGNRAAREVLGVRLHDGTLRLEDVLEPASLTLYRDVVEPQVLGGGSWQGELTLRTRLGHPMAVSARIVAHRPALGAAAGPGTPRAVSLFARDITELKSAEKKLRQLATHDYLTGLPNRLLVYDRLEHALNRFSRHGTPVALMFCDLDGFKPINDRHGHQVGDAVLTEVADRIHSVVRDTDTAARLGGDEFAVLLEDHGERSMLDVVAGRLIAAISQPIRIDGQTVQVGMSIGIAVASERLREVDAVVAAADGAMYKAKARGKGTYEFWDDDDLPPDEGEPGGGADIPPDPGAAI
jgi:diguanylate cyclase (GGDEF)-like protein/PAS domain S-box-containing protein